jgi:hypothetical protein
MRRGFEELAEDGRGLAIVSLLADRVGTKRRPVRPVGLLRAALALPAGRRPGRPPRRRHQAGTKED